MHSRMKHNLHILSLMGAIILGGALHAHAQQRLRVHTQTNAEALELVPAAQAFTGARVSIKTRGQTRTITTNGVPDHAVGGFPNAGNPHRIAGQRYTFKVPIHPVKGDARALPMGMRFGVALNGVPFDPNAAEFWRGNRQSGWQYNALGGAVALGLDANYAHVQPSGAYHYHGLPIGLMQELGWRSDRASPLIGYAADGFPIYALTAQIDGRVTKMTSSYRLKSGQRPGGALPSGAYDGAFMQDYAYVAGAGRLDACNGAEVVTAEYPQGTYAYFITDSYPVLPRCLRGAVGRGFSKR